MIADFVSFQVIKTYFAAFEFRHDIYYSSNLRLQKFISSPCVHYQTDKIFIFRLKDNNKIVKKETNLNNSFLYESLAWWNPRTTMIPESAKIKFAQCRDRLYDKIQF